MNRRKQSPGLMWFRRDLRLTDNPAWAAATETHDEVLALFVLEPALLDPASARRRDQLFAHLQALHNQLTAHGGGLVVRAGPAADALPRALGDCDAAALYYNADTTPFSTARDRAVNAVVAIPIHTFDGLTAHEPGSVLTSKGTLSQVFSPFYKVWSATNRTPWPVGAEVRAITIPGEAIPAPVGPVGQEPGEAGALDRLMLWLEKVEQYPESRDLPAVHGTSSLSADLKFGTIAARTVVDVVGVETQGREAFVRQIAWRDWWAHTIAVRPDLADSAVKPVYDNIRWRDDPTAFDRWCRGQTGFPIVDAGMRQLAETGWMHNRVRMICASFLVKDLLIDWRQGERFFRHHLIDADLAQNAGNWQWIAGTGPDAAPYFRVFNPTSQAKKFDPDGDYVRRWVPNLAALPTPAIHEPSLTDPVLLTEAGVILGESYPHPIIDHSEARVRALETYRQAVS